MNYTPIGRVRPIHRGTHDPSAAYEALDVVRRADGLASYMAKQAVPAGKTLADGEYWGLLSDAGVKAVADAACARFEASGGVAECHPVAGYPLEVRSGIEPVQSGSGDPSPDNVRPITGWAEAQLIRCGKNLLDLSQGYEYGELKPLNVPVGMSITISLFPTNGTSQLNGRIKYEDDTEDHFAIIGKNADNNIWHTYTITPEKPIKEYSMYDVDSSSKRTISKGMIELGSTATEYEPYHGDTYTATLPETVYGGELDWNTGVLTVTHSLVTLTGEEAWLKEGDYIYSSSVPVGIRGIGVCTHYPYWDGVGDFNYSKGNYVGHVGWALIIAGGIGAQFTIDEWKAYLAEQYTNGTPVRLSYKIATPTTVQLTPQEIAALEGLNTLYSSTGGTAVAGRTDMGWLTQSIMDRLAALESAAVNG